MTSALLANGLCVERGGRSVLQDFSLCAGRGTVLAVCGPNGAGKSTALKALAGLLPYAGQVLIAGRDARSYGLREHARALAYVPQHSLLQGGIVVRDVVSQGRYAHGAAWGRADARGDLAVGRALLACHAGELAQRRFGDLSGGEQRRVLLARALATQAPIVLLDEPTAGLDVAHALRFLSLMRELAAQGLTVVVVLHDLEQVRGYADGAILLAGGKVVARGRTSDVITADVVRGVYGVELAENAALGFELSERAR